MHDAAAQHFGLSASVIVRINAVFANHPQVMEVLLYGSRAKGIFHQGSDVDLSIIGEQVTHQQLLHIEAEIDDLLLPYKIDLSLFHHIDNSDLIGHIERVGKIFYKPSSR